MTTTLITGASSGLGAELARQLAARGEDLALCARRLDRLEELRAEILRAHPERRVEVRGLDVTDSDAVFEVFAALTEDFAGSGGIDRFVVNAGLGKGAPLGTGAFEANAATMTTNVLGALAQTEAAMTTLRAQQHGQLVMISSMAAMRGLPGAQAAYAASKAAVAHLAEGLRVELHGRSDIAITVLYPGYIVSEMNQRTEKKNPLLVSTEKGVAAMVSAIEKRVDAACVPPLPWAPLSVVMKHAPLGVFKKLI